MKHLFTALTLILIFFSTSSMAFSQEVPLPNGIDGLLICEGEECEPANCEQWVIRSENYWEHINFGDIQVTPWNDGERVNRLRVTVPADASERGAMGFHPFFSDFDAVYNSAIEEIQRTFERMRNDFDEIHNQTTSRCTYPCECIVPENTEPTETRRGQQEMELVIEVIIRQGSDERGAKISAPFTFTGTVDYYDGNCERPAYLRIREERQNSGQGRKNVYGSPHNKPKYMTEDKLTVDVHTDDDKYEEERIIITGSRIRGPELPDKPVQPPTTDESKGYTPYFKPRNNQFGFPHYNGTPKNNMTDTSKTNTANAVPHAHDQALSACTTPGHQAITPQEHALLHQPASSQPSTNSLIQQMIKETCDATIDVYQQNIHAMVDEGWKSPKPPRKGTWEVKLKYDLDKQGRVHNIMVIKPSGYAPIDASAVKRVREIEHMFRPLPSCFPDPTMEIDHNFIVRYR